MLPGRVLAVAAANELAAHLRKLCRCMVVCGVPAVVAVANELAAHLRGVCTGA